MKILTSEKDDFIYSKFLELLQQIKLVQGGIALDSTLKRHKDLRSYLVSKQIDLLSSYEKKFFNSDGSLKLDNSSN